VAGGTSPNKMSRIMPPPIAVIMPSVRTPTISTRATRTAVKPPLSAKANVPNKSRTSSGVGAPFIRLLSPRTAGESNRTRCFRSVGVTHLKYRVADLHEPVHRFELPPRPVSRADNSDHVLGVDFVGAAE